MIESIEMGNKYLLRFNKEYWPDLEMRVEVSGITNKAAMDNITEYNMKEELFQKYDIGLNTYLQTTDGDLYIVNEILDMATGEVDTENRILIPKQMIDYTRSDILINAYELTYTISSIKRRFSSDRKANESITEAKADLAKLLYKIDAFAGDYVSIDGSFTNYLMEQHDLLQNEVDRKNNLKQFQEAEKQNKISMENTVRQAVHTRLKYEEAFNKLSEKESQLVLKQEEMNKFYNETMSYYDINERYSDVLRKTCQLMEKAAEELGVEVPDYDTFIDEAKKDLGTVTEITITPPSSNIVVRENGYVTISVNTLAENVSVSEEIDSSVISVEVLTDKKIKISGITSGTSVLTILATANNQKEGKKRLFVKVIPQD